jgi:peroxiredoxin
MKPPFTWYNILGSLLLALLAIVVVVLTVRNRELEDHIREVTGLEPPEPLEPGMKAESISVTLLDGMRDTISFGDGVSKYLLCVFSTTCPHCETTLPKWTFIKENLRGDHYPIAISIHDLERTNKYVTERGFPFYTVIGSDPDFNLNYKISGVPVTILIDESGRVQRVWKGRLQEEDVQDILSAANQNATVSSILNSSIQ